MVDFSILRCYPSVKASENRCLGQGLSLLLVFGGEFQIADLSGSIVRNLSSSAYVGNFQA
jgi:hypothetical protein